MPQNRTLVVIPIILAGFLAGGAAWAAPLNFGTAESILIVSPTTTLTIATGSAADTLQVNATSVVVTLSSSTGGTFTLISPQALSSSTTGSGGADVQTCASGIETDTITQPSASETYTLTPTGSECASSINSGGGGSGGASGGGGSVGVTSQYGLPSTQGASLITTTTMTITTSTASGSSTAELQAELSSLLILWNSLVAQAKERGIAIPGPVGTTDLFDRNLHLGMLGPDVTRLQQFLAQDPALYPQAKVTGYFGTLTTESVQRFQEKYAIASSGTPSTTGFGTVGPKTRAKLNSLLEAGSNP